MARKRKGALKLAKFLHEKLEDSKKMKPHALSVVVGSDDTDAAYFTFDDGVEDYKVEITRYRVGAPLHIRKVE